MMDKHLWHKVETNIKSSNKPCPRWGHTCCVVNENIVFFGGYAGIPKYYHRLNLHERHLDF